MALFRNLFYAILIMFFGFFFMDISLHFIQKMIEVLSKLCIENYSYIHAVYNDIIVLLRDVKAFFVAKQDIFYIFLFALGWIIVPFYFVAIVLNGTIFSSLYNLFLKLKYKEDTKNECCCKYDYYAKRRYG